MEEEPSFMVEGNGRGDEVYEDELFYENIEAPKFVDLTAPDRYLPVNDRYWFCSRVGCDQKHEEEMDSEEIYKRFVLRVMAARSPNVRLRKALYMKDSSSNLRCPKTVPSKPSKPRVSRLALISSISKRLADPKIKAKLPTRPVGTPNSKLKQSSAVSKASTTPRIKKQLSNLETFRSVRNPKRTSNAEASKKVVAKALVFGSSRKAGKIKRTMELKTPVKDLCSAMKKLEIDSGKKKHVLGDNRPPTSDAKRNLLRGREIKSRVYDGLCSKNQGGGVREEAKSSKCMKKKNQEKNFLRRVENDSTVNKIENKSENDSVVRCSRVNDCGSLKMEVSISSQAELDSRVNDDRAVDEASLLDSGRTGPNSSANLLEGEADVLELHTPAQSGDETTVKGGEGDKKLSSLEDSNHGTENDLTSYHKENYSEGIESDDKENESVLANKNRVVEDNSRNLGNKALGIHQGQKENRKGAKVTSTLPKKTSATTPDMLKQRKPKLTNPKPFRLRTDERMILKEANLEKKLPLPPEKEAAYATPDRHARGAEKHRSRLLQQNGTSHLHVLKEAVGRVLSTTPQRHTVSSRQKLVAAKPPDKAAPKLGHNLKKGKSQVVQRIAKPQIATMDTNETTSTVTPVQLSVVKETSPIISKPKEENPKLNQISASPSVMSKPLFKKCKSRRLDAREPNFHAMHIPKSCTRKPV